MPVTKPRIRDDLTVVELDGEAVIYDEDTSELHHLNPSATIVFRLCDGTQTMREMSSDIAHAFELPLPEVEPDVRRTVRELRKAKLLEPTKVSSR